jgi:hypothetical protein
VRTYVHACMQTYVRTACMHACSMHTYMHTHACICTYMHTYIHVRIGIRTYVHQRTSTGDAAHPSCRNRTRHQRHTHFARQSERQAVAWRHCAACTERCVQLRAWATVRRWCVPPSLSASGLFRSRQCARHVQPVDVARPLHDCRFRAVLLCQPAQLCRGRGQSRCRCGRSESSPGADVAAVSPAPVQMGRG